MFAFDERFLEMSVEEFLAWDGGDPDVKYELIDGHPVAMAPARVEHGAIQSTLARLIENHLLARNSPCRAITEPGIVPRIDSRRNFRVADIAVTCAPPDPKQVAIEDPILIVEILSPGNEADTRLKVPVYANIPSVREILLIRSDRIEVLLYRRQTNGVWPSAPLILGHGDTLSLECLGYEVTLTEVYRRTHLAPA